MRFDANRLAVLAGLPQGGNGLLKEGAHLQDEADLGLYEMEDEGAGAEENIDSVMADEMAMYEDEDADNDAPPEDGEAPPEDGELKPIPDDALDFDEMITVDENLLRNEIMKMKQQRLAENKIRKAVRQEIAAILSEEYDDDNLYLTSDWLYGDNKPTNSRKGTVATALPGLGFKQF